MTLTQTAVLVKQIIAVSVIGLILSVGGFIGYKIWHSYYLASLPPVEEKPDTKFGLLPAINFPQAGVSTSNYTYSLDTTTGGLPIVGTDPGFEKIIKVYFVTQTFASFLAPQKSEDLAVKFGINNAPEILSETKYKFRNEEKTLLVDLNNGNFSYSKFASVSATIKPDNEEKIVDGFKQNLSFLGKLKEDIKDARTKIILLKYEGGSFKPTELIPETQAVQVSLWPSPIDKKTVLTANYNKSLINAIILGNAAILDNYVSLEYIHFPVDTSTFASYPIKTTENAFEDLKSGKGVVIVQPDKPQVSITAVTLAYYLSEIYSPYLQPIFVFEGPSFVAYVPAISEQFQTTATGN